MKKIVLILFFAGLILSTTAWAAEDGAALYKSKCAMCHKPDGSGNPGKVPALKGTSLSEDQIAAVLTKGAADKKAPHNSAFKGFDEAQAKAVAGYVKSMK